MLKSYYYRKAFWTVCALLWLRALAPAADHPFILWNEKDIEELRRLVETEPWAQKAYRNIRSSPPRYEKAFANLFAYAVMGEKEAGEEEKKKLMSMVHSPVPRGAAQYINVLRYDQLYGLLSEKEREEVRDCFQVYINNHIFRRAIFDERVFNDSRNYSRYDAKIYTRTNWLPNIIWPWKVSANMMAAALGDEALIRRTWGAYGSWKWYFDRYLCDTGFYSEEFSKMGSTPGAMLLYSRGLERLGLNELGFGYKGKGGATMRGHIESLIHLGYPRVDLGSTRPQYPLVTMGDLRQKGSSHKSDFPSPAFQHSIVVGYLPDGTGGNVRWRAHGAWGGTKRGDHAQWDGYTGFTPKMQLPFWFEIGDKRWPETGFDYFLYHMRKPDQDRYIPSLYFGLEPIGPAEPAPPPAPSAVWPERGLVMLRCEESPSYWESEAPAVCMRLASNYAHNVRDAFALLGFYAFNRPIFLNRQITAGYANGWSRSIQSHCGIRVDNEEPRFTREVSVRKLFNDTAKFVAARSNRVYPGVDVTRSLVLTRQYLLDLVHFAGESEHRYSWFVHTLGTVEPEASWSKADLPAGFKEFTHVRRLGSSKGSWSVKAVQKCALQSPGNAGLPEIWYRRRVGVRLTMAGSEGTEAYVCRTPLPWEKYRDEDGKRRYRKVKSEVGGVSVIAVRKAPVTTFPVLCEPFENGKGRIKQFTKVDQTEHAVAVSVKGEGGLNDRVMVSFRPDSKEPVTLEGKGELYKFGGYGHVRIESDTVSASGDIEALKIRVEGTPGLVINGEKRKASVSGGYLVFEGKE